jgi:hypothetical protein
MRRNILIVLGWNLMDDFDLCILVHSNSRPNHRLGKKKYKLRKLESGFWNTKNIVEIEQIN